VRRHRLLHALAESFWLIPLLGVAAGIGLSFLTVAIDHAYDNRLVSERFVGSAAGAEQSLGTIAASVVSLTTLVLTVTLVAIQLAMAQFSPRIVRALLDNRADQTAIGVFAATFTFALFALRAVDTGSGASVPGLTILTAYGLVVASGIVLFAFVHRAGHRLRVGGLIDLVGEEMLRQIERIYPERHPGRGRDDVVTSPRNGNLLKVDHEGLVDVARRAGCALELVPVVGDYVVTGGPLFRVHGDGARLDRTRLPRHVVLGRERIHAGDPSYGLRKLVDVALRALTPAQNDPTTASQVINRIQEALRQLAVREFPDGRFRDDDGHVRLVLRTLAWSGYVRLAFDEIRLLAPQHPQVTRRLEAALRDIKSVAPENRQAPLDRQLRLLEEAVPRTLESDEDVRAALVPDAQGIGSAADLELDGAVAERDALRA
jgi:uncharacterized membrane protein